MRSSAGSWKTTPSGSPHAFHAHLAPRERAQALDHRLDQHLGRRGAGRDADAGDAAEPRGRGCRRRSAPAAPRTPALRAISTRRLLFEDSGAPTTSTRSASRAASPSPRSGGSASRSRCRPCAAAGTSGKRARSASSTSRVSSTESVVCVSTAEPRRVARPRGAPTSGDVSTSCMRSGACPIVPSTSTWPAWPTSTISWPSRAKRRASTCTLVTSGQVASIAAQALRARPPRAPPARRRAR